MKILNELSVNNNKKIALLIRHSDRDKIPEGRFGNEILLNDKGVKNAINYGKKLKSFNIKKIYTSPIKRCVQTAELIRKGYGQNLEIIKTKILGDPGVHVNDAEKVGEYYLKYGFWNMYEKFKKQVYIEGLPTHSELKQNLENFLKKETTEGVTLFITHDALIAFYAIAALLRNYTEENWVDYLNGLILQID